MVAIKLVLIAAALTLVHDHRNPANDAWLKELASGRGLCCDGSDAVRVDDPDWTVAEDARFTDVNDKMVECRRNTYSGWNERVGEENSHGRYCVRLRIHPKDDGDQEMAWFFVPDKAVVSHSGNGVTEAPARNQDGQTRVWPMTSTLGDGRETVYGVRCFLPGVLG